MFHRFAAASAVASVIIAIATAFTLLILGWSATGVRILTAAWCFVPLAWGVWAMLAPAAWVPERLPLWGAILGVAAGIMAGPVLDLPGRLAGLHDLRWITVIVGPVFYCILWVLVPIAYRALQVAAPPPAGTGGPRPAPRDREYRVEEREREEATVGKG